MTNTITIKGITYKIDLKNKQLINIKDDKDIRLMDESEYDWFKSVVEGTGGYILP
jgi:hypothetical protein